MTKVRTQCVDYDARPQPKTDVWCCACQRDIKQGRPCRWVYLTEDMHAVHPGDLIAHGIQVSDLGWHRIGMDCARKLGLEWTTDSPINKSA